MTQVHLTDRFCLSAKTGEYFDELTCGLTLRVRDTGRKTFTLMYTSPRDGKRARWQLGTYPGTTLAQARTGALELQSMVAGGRRPSRRPRCASGRRDDRGSADRVVPREAGPATSA
jgi:hypothetical protein